MAIYPLQFSEDGLEKRINVQHKNPESFKNNHSSFLEDLEEIKALFPNTDNQKREWHTIIYNDMTQLL